MAFNVSENKRDRFSEQQGSWMPYDADCAFLVARNNSSAYSKFISKCLRENASNKNGEDEGSLTDEQLLEGASNFLLLGWRGVVDGKKEVPYSVEAAKSLLDEHDDLYREIALYATARSNYLLKRDAKDAKNLKK
jgi:hypothetical protein